MKNIKNSKFIIKFVFTLYFNSIFKLVCYADPIGPGGAISGDLSSLKDAVSQWGTTAAGICILFTGSCAVCSLILPWKFFKETLGRPSWMGLACSVFVYVALSFFGNSIHQSLTAIFQCPLAIIGAPCN